MNMEKGILLFCWLISVINDTLILDLQTDEGDEELCSVFVPTNHLYIGDVLLVNANDVIRPNMSIREGIGTSLVFLVSCLLMCHSLFSISNLSKHAFYLMVSLA